MAVLEINRSSGLKGTVSPSGAKNAALPILIGSMLCDGEITLENVPLKLMDVSVVIRMLEKMGAEFEINHANRTVVKKKSITTNRIPQEEATKIRYSLLLLAVLLQKFGEVYLPVPGGCDIGTRKYDLHLMGLRSLGADVEESETGINGVLPGGRFSGSEVWFTIPTTSGTENIVLAACLAEGPTVINNAHTRPEVLDFISFLRTMGANITTGNRQVAVNGCKSLRGDSTYTIMNDSHEAMTFMIAASVAGGDITVTDHRLFDFLNADIEALKSTGVSVEKTPAGINVSSDGTGLKGFSIFTGPYPGINSDMHPLFSAMALGCRGNSDITDRRFTDRFQYISEMARMGASIDVTGNRAEIIGPQQLHGAEVTALDLRCGAALVVAAMLAEGKTVVDNIYQIDRGYESIETKLASLGADIKRV